MSDCKCDGIESPSRYFNKNAEPICMCEWSRLFSDHQYQVIEKTDFKDLFISTVWLGMDHGFGNHDRPIIFETMIFKGDEGELQRRWATEEEAVEGHDKIVRALKSGVEPSALKY